MIFLFDTVGNGTAHGNFNTCQGIRRRMVNICTGYTQSFGGFPLIYFRLKTARVRRPCKVKVLGNKLILAAVFTDDACLPCKKIRDKLTAESFVFRTETSVDGTPDIRKILPVVYPVTPLIEAELVIQIICSAEFFL